MRYRLALTLLGFVMLPTVVGGCSSAEQEKPQSWREVWNTSRPQPVSHPHSGMLYSGPAPLVYMAQDDMTVFITDSTGARWGPAPLAARRFVRISDDKGIAVGPIILYSGRLTPGRIYTIVADFPTHPDQSGSASPTTRP